MAGFMQEFSASAAQQTMNICFGERLWSLTLILDTGLWYSFYCSALKKKVVLWRNEQPDYFPRAYNQMECLFISSCALRHFEPKNFWVSLGLFSVSLHTGTPGMAGQWEHSQCNITCLKTQTPAISKFSVKGFQICDLILSLINRGAKYQLPFRGTKYQHPLIINAGKKGLLVQY